MSYNGLIGRAAELPAANGIIRTAKHLPEVSKAVVWGRVALCLAGASCDWWGGNIEKLIIPGCRIHRSPLLGPDDRDAWPPLE